MAVELIDGWWCDSRTYPDIDQRTYNVLNLIAYFKSHGWTDNAIAGLAGNTEVESRQNPGLMETRPASWPTDTALNSYKRGIGLTQWTSSNAPPQKLINWAIVNGMDWRSGWIQCFRIYRESVFNYQWAKNNVQGVTFPEWTQMTETPERMSDIFARAYERAASTDFATRRQWARHWWDLIQSDPDLPVVPADPPIGPEPPPGPETRVPIWLLFKIKEDNSRHA